MNLFCSKMRSAKINNVVSGVSVIFESIELVTDLEFPAEYARTSNRRRSRCVHSSFGIKNYTNYKD